MVEQRCHACANRGYDCAMNFPDHERLFAALLPAVLQAGRLEMRYRAAGLTVETKTDTSPVTAADREAELILVAALHEAAPQITVIAEEQSAAGAVPPKLGDRFFLVDPLDGTREYVAGGTDFTVNIGLIDGGFPVFGIVYAPALSRLYATVGLRHAIEAEVDPEARILSLEDLRHRRIETRAPPVAGLTALQSRSRSSAETDAWLAAYPVHNRLRLGSSLKFCVIARGDGDLYPQLGGTCEWDTAAGQALVEAAGGRVTTLDGARLRYGRAEGGYRNPQFVAWARAPLAPAG